MDTKQYTGKYITKLLLKHLLNTSGLGQYLQEIDPQHHPILWQLKGIIIFCRVHFFRTITETVGNTNRTTGVWSRMASLVDCKSKEDYDQLCDLLIGKYFLTG
jgi:hypothetical protein